jgi:hypothetical protein
MIMSRLSAIGYAEVVVLGKLVAGLMVEAVVLIVYHPFILKKLI